MIWVAPTYLRHCHVEKSGKSKIKMIHASGIVQCSKDSVVGSIRAFFAAHLPNPFGALPRGWGRAGLLL